MCMFYKSIILSNTITFFYYLHSQSRFYCVKLIKAFYYINIQNKQDDTAQLHSLMYLYYCTCLFSKAYKCRHESLFVACLCKLYLLSSGFYRDHLVQSRISHQFFFHDLNFFLRLQLSCTTSTFLYDFTFFIRLHLFLRPHLFLRQHLFFTTSTFRHDFNFPARL